LQTGPCKLHGGKTRNHVRAAQRQQAAEAVKSLGMAREVDPHIALLGEAIDAGVAERQVRLAEAQAQQLAQVIRAILTDLRHDLADEQVCNVVRLRLTEGGSGDRQLPPGRPGCLRARERGGEIRSIVRWIQSDTVLRTNGHLLRDRVAPCAAGAGSA
jgi:hypothetical protein